MKTLVQLQNQLSSGQFEFNSHALKRTVERNISDIEINQAGKDAMIIEDYPDDKYSPSCLLLGFTKNERPLHIKVSLMKSEFVKIITLYQPDEFEWTNNYSKRR